MKKTTVEFELITPAFIGGAMQTPEFRIPSMKGLLRFWYRAIDPNYPEYEQLLFGSTDRTSLLRFRQVKPWISPREVSITIPKSPSRKGSSFTGIRYITFPFLLSDEKRTALRHNQRFPVDFILHRQPDPDCAFQERISMALWSLVTMGGIGARSRRGFGSIRITGISSPWPGMEYISNMINVSSIDEWWDCFLAGLEFIKRELQQERHHKPDHFNIGKGTRFLLFGRGPKQGFSSWTDALDSFGNRLRTLRKSASPAQKTALGYAAPANAVDDSRKTPNEGIVRYRAASPIISRVVRIESEFFYLVTISKSPVCARHELALIQDDEEWQPGTPDPSILDYAWDYWKRDARFQKEVD